MVRTKSATNPSTHLVNALDTVRIDLLRRISKNRRRAFLGPSSDDESDPLRDDFEGL